MLSAAPPHINLAITTDGSWRQDSKLGGCAMATVCRSDGKVYGKYWATRRDDNSTAVELKGICNALETLLAGVTARGIDTAGDTRFVAIWTDCMDAVSEIDLALFGEAALQEVLRRSSGRVTSVIHVEIVQAILDARDALMAKGCSVWVEWRRRDSYPEIRAADEWARQGAVLAERKSGNWNTGPDHAYPTPGFFRRTEAPI